MLALAGVSSPRTSWRCTRPPTQRCGCYLLLALWFGFVSGGQPACETADTSVSMDFGDFSGSSFDDLLDASDLDTESLVLLQKKAHVTTEKKSHATGRHSQPSSLPIPVTTEKKSHATQLHSSKSSSPVETYQETLLADTLHRFKRGGRYIGAVREVNSSQGWQWRRVIHDGIVYGVENFYMNVGLLCFGVLVVCISLALWCCGKTADPMLKVQLKVDHFASHSMLHPQRLSADKLLKGALHSASAAERLLKAEGSYGCMGVKAAAGMDQKEPKYATLSAFADIRAPAAGKDRRSGTRKHMEPILTLPLCETWYAVGVESMRRKDGSFHILRIAGYPMLHGRIRRSREARMLDISSSGLPAKDGQILATVSMPLRDVAPEAVPVGQGPTFRVTGYWGRQIGDLRPGKEGQYELICDSDNLMSIAVAGDQLVIHAADSGKALTQASWFDDAEIFDGVGHLAMCVNSGVDTVLAISCVLAMIVFGEDADLPKLDILPEPHVAAPLAG